MNKQEIYAKIWHDLQDAYGFSEGDDISYFQFCEACDAAKVDPDDLDMDDFQETYNVVIG